MSYVDCQRRARRLVTEWPEVHFATYVDRQRLEDRLAEVLWSYESARERLKAKAMALDTEPTTD